MALGPYTEKTPLELIHSAAISGTSGYRINDKTITLDFTEEAAISQTTATKAITVQPYEFARFDGYLKLNPESDLFVSDKLVPTTTNQTADTLGFNNLVNSARQPGVLNSTIFPVNSSNDLLLSSLTPFNATQLTGGLLSSTSGLNVPVLLDNSNESVWGVLNPEPAATDSIPRTVDGQIPITSLTDFFGRSTDQQQVANTSSNSLVVENSIGIDSSRRTTGGASSKFGFDVNLV